MTRDIKKILLLDADPQAQGEMAEAFSKDGIVIDLCANLVDAVRSVKESSYVCAVVDVDIIDAPWEQAVGVLKAVDESLPIILTAETNTRDLEIKVRGQDVFYYYIKSFDREELRLAVLEAMRLSRDK